MGHDAYAKQTQSQIDDLVANRYIRGLVNDDLRRELVREYNGDGNVMHLTVKHSKLLSTKRIGTNQVSISCPCKASVIRVAHAKIRVRCDICRPRPLVPTIQQKGEVIQSALGLAEQRYCYNCHLPGHLKRECPLTVLERSACHATNLNDQFDESQNACSPLAGLKQMRGSLKINGSYCDFLTDTGAERTIINSRMIPSSMRHSVQPSGLTLLVATGIVSSVLGEMDCDITLGHTVTSCRVLVTDDLNTNCLLGMDFLTRCPLTRGPLEALFHAITAGLSSELDMTPVKVGASIDPVQCFRAQVLTNPDYTLLHQNDSPRVLVSQCHPELARDTCKIDPYARDEYDFPKSDIPARVFHDVFQVVDDPTTLEPPMDQ